MSSGNYVAAFITGHSVCGCTGLSREQLGFQQRSSIPAESWLTWNFPFFPTRPFPDSVPLLAASLNNIGHFAWSRFPAFRARHRDSVSAVFSRYGRVILLAGSCGLELLRNLRLAPEVLGRIHVFACGPVSLGLPGTASCVLVQGEEDLISRAFHREVDHRYPCSHMGYLDAPDTLRLFNEFCVRVLNDSPAAP